MGRNINHMNYKVSRSSHTDEERNEIKEFKSRKEVESYAMISASTMLRMIRTNTMKIVNNEIYLIERIVYDNLIQSL
tara:strand:+ start:721 stop:951 length:231 start_codon:yes stop_codon:yes gene_type:complete